MQIEQTIFPGVMILTPQRFGEERGWFSDIWSATHMTAAGFDLAFVQENHSMSAAVGTFRGLHSFVTRLPDTEVQYNCSDVYAPDCDGGIGWDLTGEPILSATDSLLDAGNFVRTLELRQGHLVGSPDEIAFRYDWITPARLAARAEVFRKNDYGQYLADLSRHSE